MTRSDALPEGERHTLAPCGHSIPCGCAGVAACCFNCPLPRCRYEMVGGLRAIRNGERNPAIVAARAAGERPDDIARRFGIGRRMVQKVLAVARA